MWRVGMGWGHFVIQRSRWEFSKHCNAETYYFRVGVQDTSMSRHA